MQAIAWVRLAPCLPRRAFEQTIVAMPAVRSAVHVIGGLGDLPADLWPCTARLEADGDVSVGGLRLSALAARYGTPACILDEADVRARCRGYADAFPGAEIAYAGKAFLCRAMARWIAEEGLSLDVCSGDVLAVDVPLPAGTRPGDLLAVPVTGAYNHAMASQLQHGRAPALVRDVGV